MKSDNESEKPVVVSDKTKIKFTLVGTFAICATIMSSAWFARGYVEDFRNTLYSQLGEIRASQDKMTAALNYKWTVGQMEQWSNALDRNNREVARRDNSNKGLIVPDPLSIISH